MKVLSLYRENSEVMLASEPSFNIMNSEILGFVGFLPTSEIELGPCSPKLTAATA